MLSETTVQFQGVRGGWLLTGLMMAVAGLLVGAGVWQVLRGRRRPGVCSIAAAVAVPLIWLIVRVGTGSQPSQGLWLVLLAVHVTAAVGAFYAMVYAFLGPRRVAVLMALRAAAVVCLMLALFKPLVRREVGAIAARPHLPVLVDCSGSMSTVDPPAPAGRLARSLQALATQRSILAERFRPAWYRFATQARGLDEFAALTRADPTAPEADRTDLAGAISAAAANYDKSELAGLLIVSDGIHGGPRQQVIEAARDAGVPVYAVGVGSDREAAGSRRNIELVSVDAPLTAIENNVTTISARVRMVNMAATPARIELREPGREGPVATARLWTQRDSYETTVKLTWTPGDRPAAGDGETADVRRLRVVIPTAPGETAAHDNHTELHVLITRPRIRVLYVEGTMRPEYKYLRRVLTGDLNIQLMSLVRVAGNRFWATGSIGGRKLSGLPTTDADFALIDVMILGDLDRSFVGVERMARIRRFVNDGGALLMLGGRSSFGPGGYGGTEIEAVLPVVTGPREQGQETTAFLPSLTAVGTTHPVLSGLADYFSIPGRNGPKPGTALLPSLRGCVRVARAKAAATVLAVHPSRRNRAGPLTVLAVQNYGGGRTAAFTADTTWQWYMQMRGMGDASPYSRFWGQLVRWLARTDVRGRKSAPAAVMRPDRSHARVGQRVKVLAYVQTAQGLPANDARVVCRADLAGGGRDLPMARSAAGLYQAELAPDKPGSYRLTVTAGGRSGAVIGRDEMPLEVLAHSSEQARLARDVGLLREIAQVSGGRYADLAGLPEIVDLIIARQASSSAPAPPVRSVRLYNFWVLLAVFVCLMTAEWSLRRYWQLH